MTNDPKILTLAFLGGIIPALLWLWFWIKEEENKPEPKGILLAVFVAGMISVVIVLQIEKFIQVHVTAPNLDLVLWAASEEIIKYFAVLIILYGTTYISE